MDNSSQNDPGVPNQPETQNSSGYQQYLDPGKKPKNPLRKILFIAGGGMLLLAIILVAALATQKQEDKSGDQGQLVRETVTCGDEQCLASNFQSCTPSEYTYENADISSVKYKIQGFGEIGCSVEMSYLSSKYDAEIQDKSMVCDFDNTVELDSAVQYVMDFPDDYDCQGALAEFLKTLDDI